VAGGHISEYVGGQDAVVAAAGQLQPLGFIQPHPAALCAVPTSFLQFCKVLQVVLPRCGQLSSPRDICSLLQVSSTVRQAVQQSRGHLQIEVGRQLTTLSGLAAWLPRHTGLVSSMSLFKPTDAAAQQVARTMMALSLELCAAQRTPAAAGAGEPLQPLPLSLRQFSSDYLALPTVMTAVAWPGLQYLLLVVTSSQVTPAFCRALGSMQLACLNLSLERREGWPPQLAAAVGELQVSKLYMGFVDAAAVQLLPESLTSLDFRALDPGTGRSGGVYDVSHLTALRELHCSSYRQPTHQLVLPRQRVTLRTTGAWQLSGDWELDDVTLSWSGAPGAEGSCEPYLRLLQQLPSSQEPGPRSLQLMMPGIHVDVAHESAAAATAVGRLTALTKLSCSSFASPYVTLPILAAVPNLLNLVELNLQLKDPPARAVLQLSSLGRLTALRLLCTTGCDDLDAVALACSLTRLQTLSIISLVLTSWSMLPAVARLTDLRCLDITGPPPSLLDAATLQQLLPLTGLTYLSLPLQRVVCPQEGVEQFLAQMPFLTCVKSLTAL